MKNLSKLPANELAALSVMSEGLAGEDETYFTRMRLRQSITALLELPREFEIDNEFRVLVKQEVEYREAFDPDTLILFISGLGQWDVTAFGKDVDRERFIYVMGIIYDGMQKRIAEKQAETIEL